MNNDLISREALKKAMNEEALNLSNGGRIFIENINKIIDNAPTVESDYEWGYSEGVHDTDRPQGEWIDVKDIPYLANCSHCGYQIDTHEEHGYFNYCPYCGADMRDKKIQTPSCLTNPERKEELLERYKEVEDGES